jgi:hypothetical protein
VYYYGSRAQKRSYETLNLFLYYAKPKNAVEHEHNKTTLQKDEAIRAKRLPEMEPVSAGIHLHRYHYHAELTFEQVDSG